MIQRALALVIVAGVLGPPIAAVSFLVLTGVFRFGVRALAALGPDILGLAFTPYTWLLATVPALASGVVNAVAARFLPTEVLRLLIALPVGAVAFLICLNWLLWDPVTGVAAANDVAAVGLSGALASLVCVALVESFGRTPETR
jgi:hypothetical protein